MLLKEYLDNYGLKYGAFAGRIGISYRSLWCIMNGMVDVPLSVALRIEELTKKKVTCRELHKSRMLKKKQDEERKTQENND